MGENGDGDEEGEEDDDEAALRQGWQATRQAGSVAVTNASGSRPKHLREPRTAASAGNEGDPLGNSRKISPNRFAKDSVDFPNTVPSSSANVDNLLEEVTSVVASVQLPSQLSLSAVTLIHMPDLVARSARPAVRQVLDRALRQQNEKLAAAKETIR